MAFETLVVGIVGSALLVGGAGAILALDGAPFGSFLVFGNACGGAIACGTILARNFERARSAEEARRLELTEALANIKTLRGMLPVCAWCRRVRTDSGYWQQIEAYVAQHTDAEFSHGLCEECDRKHFADLGADPPGLL